MNLIESVKSFLSGNVAIPPLPLVNNYFEDNKTQIGKPPVYPSANIATYMAAYNTNATIYTILTYISQKFGTVPRYCYKIDDEQSAKSLKYLLKQSKIDFKNIKTLSKKAYGNTAIKPDLTPEGRLAALTARPNDKQGQDSYYAEVELFHELTGETYVYLNRGIGYNNIDIDGQLLDDDVVIKMPVLEKIVLPTQWVNPVPSKTDINEIIYYQFQDTPGHYVNISTVNIIHWKKTNPNYDGAQGTHLRGMAPLAAALRLLTQDNSATDAAVSMQQNQGARGLLVNKSIANPTPTQIGQIRDVVDTNINGTNNKSNISFLGGSDYDYFNFGQSAVDMQLLDSQQQIFIRLCNVFGVPPAIFLTQTTYENLQQAVKTFLTNKIIPSACSFKDEENRVLLPAFGLDPSQYTTDIDATLITELSEDMTALATQLSLSNWKTINEKRKATGDEPLEDPNADKILVSNTLISLDDLSVNDELDSYSGMGNSNKPTNGLHEQADTEAGNAGNAGNASSKRPRVS